MSEVIGIVPYAIVVCLVPIALLFVWRIWKLMEWHHQRETALLLAGASCHAVERNGISEPEKQFEWTVLKLQEYFPAQEYRKLSDLADWALWVVKSPLQRL